MMLNERLEGSAREGSTPTLTETPPDLISLKISDCRFDCGEFEGEKELNPEEVVGRGVFTGDRELSREEESEAGIAGRVGMAGVEVVGVGLFDKGKEGVAEGFPKEGEVEGPPKELVGVGDPDEEGLEG